MNAREYIAYLERQFGPTTDDTLDRDKLRANLAATAALGLIDPSDVERLSLTSLRHALKEDAAERANKLAAAIRRLGFALPMQLEIGFFQTRDFNALALAAPDGSPLCILDTFLHRSLSLASAAIVEATIAPSDPSHARDIPKCVSCLGAAYAVLARKFVAPSFPNISLFKIDPRWTEMTFHLTSAMSDFILSHELAHHALGHVRSIRRLNACPGVPKVEANVYQGEQSDEFEADRVGADIFLESREPSDVEELACAPMLFFAFMSFGEHIVGIQEDDSPLQGSHPPSADRKRRLSEYLKPKLHPQTNEYYAVAEQAWAAFDKLISTLRSSDGRWMEGPVEWAARCGDDAAIGELDAMLREDPTNAYALFAKGTLLARQGRLEEALTCLREAASIEPDRPEIWFNLAGVALNKNDREAGRAFLERAAALGHEKAIAAIEQLKRGEAVRFRGKEDKVATAVGRRTITRNDEIELCIRMSAAGDHKGALKGLDQVLTEDPRNAYALFAKGNLFARTGKLDDALDCLRAAVSIEPERSEIWFNLAAIAMAKKDGDAGHTYLEKAAELGHPKAQSALAQMKRGKIVVLDIHRSE